MDLYWIRLALLGLLFPLMAHANLSGGDDFNDNSVDASKWGADEIRNYGTFTETNQRLEYTATMPTNMLGMVFHHWTASYGSYTQDWSAQVDVSVANLSLTGSDVFFIGLAVANPANSFYQVGGTALRQKSTGYEIARDIQYSSSSSTSTTLVTSGSVSLQIRYDSATHTLYESYDADGATGGYQWAEEVGYNVSAWGMDSSSQFQLELSAGGMNSTTRTITSGQVYADNLSSTPEPSTGLFLLTGLACIGAVRRYKKSARVNLPFSP